MGRINIVVERTGVSVNWIGIVYGVSKRNRLMVVPFVLV